LQENSQRQHQVPDDDAARREEVRSLLALGLATEVFPRADNTEETRNLIARLRASDGSLTSRLVIGGFTLRPVEQDGIEQRCESCMYYQVHRRYCVLPELDVPVEAEWSCRLWRI
jgi:hypothetical protein